MYNTTVEITTDEFGIRLNLWGLVNVITGDSATGKTYMATLIEHLKAVISSDRQGVKSNIKMEELIVCTARDTLDAILSNEEAYNGKTIIVDRYDVLCSNKLDEFIRTGKNRFILMSHSNHKKFNLPLRNVITLDFDLSKRLFYSKPYEEYLDNSIQFNCFRKYHAIDIS